MKKRILALALAGTTAFSVFGAAMSANAADGWWTGSTHVVANDDAYYRHYTPAGDITWGVNGVGSDYVTVGADYYFAGTQEQYDDLPLANGTVPGVNSGWERVVRGYSIYSVPGKASTAYNSKAGVKDYTKDDDNYTYFTSYDEFASSIHATHYTAVTGENGVVEDSTGREYIIAQRVNGTDFYIFDKEVWDKYIWGNGSGEIHDAFYGKYFTNENGANVGEFFFNNDFSVMTLAEADSLAGADGMLDNVASVGAQIMTKTDAINAFKASRNGTDWYMISTGGNNVDTNMHHVWGANNYVYTGGASLANNLFIDGGSNFVELNDVDPNFEDVMAEPVELNTVYLYDYYEDLPRNVSLDEFADAWADGTVAELLYDASNKTQTTGTLEPDTSYLGRDLRMDVNYAWIDFLDNLGISDASNEELTLWAENLYQNYIYNYYDASVVVDVRPGSNGQWIVTIDTNRQIDLYNFDELLSNILYYAPSDKAATAQTSELVYLMQQYNKYVNEGFVDVKPVETDDWGDLLVSLALAPTEDDFRTTNAYDRYMRVAEDRVQDYQEADTAYAVTLAEQRLYDFITDYQTAYTATGDVDTTALGQAIDDTYFNYDWRKAYNADNAAGVYAGYTEEDGDLKGTNPVDTDLGVRALNGTWPADTYALYPAYDYSGSNTGSYPGVTNGVDAAFGVNDSYYWFYNVYTLAYDIFTESEYQGTVDLMASTLNEAVANLVPTTTARASDVLGAEESNDKLADLVETDYTEAMWANRNKIYNYVTERVSNDETGRVGASNAEAIADLMATHLGLQRNQTVVTRSEIADVTTAKANAEAALEALRNDEDNYNAAQATALQNAIDNCDYIIDLYNGDYARVARSQSVNADFNAAVGDKDQILKSDITDAVQAVDDAINFKNVIMGWTDTDEGWKYGVNDADGPHYLNDGWHQVDGGKTWFYFNEDGTAKQSEWWQDGSTWYWFNSNCGAAVGWAKIDGDWYYFKGNNAMKTGWEKVEGSWYYMNSSGKMVTGWCQINGTWYYFSKESNALGQMLANTTTPDGYKVDANGALVE